MTARFYISVTADDGDQTAISCELPGIESFAVVKFSAYKLAATLST